jgi:hypothetical protein
MMRESTSDAQRRALRIETELVTELATLPPNQWREFALLLSRRLARLALAEVDQVEHAGQDRVPQSLLRRAQGGAR